MAPAGGGLLLGCVSASISLSLCTCSADVVMATS